MDSYPHLLVFKLEFIAHAAGFGIKVVIGAGLETADWDIMLR